MHIFLQVTNFLDRGIQIKIRGVYDYFQGFNGTLYVCTELYGERGIARGNLLRLSFAAIINP